MQNNVVFFAHLVEDGIRSTTVQAYKAFIFDDSVLMMVKESNR